MFSGDIAPHNAKKIETEYLALHYYLVSSVSHQNQRVVNAKDTQTKIILRPSWYHVPKRHTLNSKNPVSTCTPNNEKTSS